MPQSLEHRLSDYMQLGYAPKEPPKSWRRDFLRPPTSPPVADVGSVSNIFSRTMDDIMSNVAPGKRCIIPLSGGWDSRLLLAAALERLDSNQIRTVTFGMPGQLDFDIGCSLSRSLNLNCTRLDLSELFLEWNRLVESADMAPWTYMPDALFNDYSKSQSASYGDVVIGGFLGGPTTLVKSNDTYKPHEGKRLFFESQIRTSEFTNVGEGLFSGIETPIRGSVARYSVINTYDIFIRQPSCIAPIITGISNLNKTGPILGTCRASGAISASPFASPTWVNYWASLPPSSRIDRRLFLEFCKAKYPDLFNKPSKYSLGAPNKRSLSYGARLGYYGCQYVLDRAFKKRRRFQANLNYVNYAEFFRRREDYISCVRTAAAELNSLHPNSIAIDRLLNNHQKGVADMSAELLIVLGAGANLAATRTHKL